MNSNEQLYLIGPGHYLSRDVLEQIGRVAIAAAVLEVAVSVHHPDHEEARRQSGDNLVKQARHHANRLPDEQRRRVCLWLDQVTKLLGRRNMAVHTFAVLWTTERGDLTVARVHPRSRTRTVDDGKELSQLVREIEVCAGAGLDLNLELSPPGQPAP